MSESALRRSLPSRVHKERSQPAGRAKLGLLEKKKDYKERSKDHHRKENALKALKEKASFRNPDEFYFGMVHAKTKDGVHRVKTGKAHSAETIKQMQTQDMGYLNHKKATEEKRIDKLQSELHLLSDTPLNKHTIFLDSSDAVKTFDPAEYFDTVPELAHRAFNRPRVETLKSEAAHGAVDSASLSAAEKAKTKQYEELGARLNRKRKIDEVLGQLAQQKNLLSKGRRVKITKRDKFGEVDEKQTVYKWKLERKR